MTISTTTAIKIPPDIPKARIKSGDIGLPE
jgi:hypothetical protein